MTILNENHCMVNDHADEAIRTGTEEFIGLKSIDPTQAESDTQSGI
ncbi:hypothetical protein [Spirosoma aerolatum]|nr:hypothetical protein [Spirosoma aerolatum]